MKFVNHSPFAAALLRSVGEDDARMFNNLIVRARFQLGPDGLEPASSAAQPEDIRREAVEDQVFGRLEPDQVFPRRGTDLIIHAHARPTPGEPASLVELRAGPYAERLAVSGERRWLSRAGQIFASDPAPLDGPVPLSYAEAFGGSCSTEHGELAYPANPIGRGFALSADDAEGRLLPRVEFADELIRAWDERPEPAGFAAYPKNWAARLEQFVDREGEQPRVELDNRMFNLAHPRLSGAPIEAGERVELRGVDTSAIELRDPALSFTLPAAPVELRVRLGDWEGQVDLVLAELFLNLPEACVELCFNGVFDYRFQAHQVRVATLTEVCA